MIVLFLRYSCNDQGMIYHNFFGKLKYIHGIIVDLI